MVITMKKLILFSLTLAILLGSLTIGTLAKGSYFGYGAEAVAADVKMIKSGLAGRKLCFTDADFKSAMCLSEFKSITVTKLPESSDGTLFIGGRRVSEGRVIKQKNLGALVFVPKDKNVTEASFTFSSEGYMGGAEIECIMKFSDKVNYAPKIDKDFTSEAIATQENISVYERLSAADPEGDEVEFIIVSYPKNGTLELKDSLSGSFTYTPTDGYTGRDSFIYAARDSWGNYSLPTKVIIRVNERMCDTVYTDMTDREEYNGAVAMTAMGVMGGKLVGDDLYFMPEEKVSRAEFVAMLLKCRGIKADSSITSTFFDDDSEIPASLRGYVNTAQRLGIAGGDFKDGKLLFSPNEPITKYEAAKMMAALIGEDKSGEEDVFAEDDGTPVWARSGVIAMKTLGIFDESDAKESSAEVTRADTAEFLYKLMKIK